MSSQNPRFKSFDMTTLEVLMAMGEGNPGALTAMMELMKAAPKVDPDSFLAELTPIITLDMLDCYGSRIWMLFKDVCGQNVVDTLGVLRAYQLGLVSETDLNHAIDNRGVGIDVRDLVNKVKEQLPMFGESR